MTDKLASELLKLSSIIEKKGFSRESYELAEIANELSKEAEELLNYKIEYEQEGDADILKIGFVGEAHNDKIVKDAVKLMKDVGATKLKGGPILKITGPASLPVAMAIAHEIGHKYGAVACYDPKLRKYVVAISHNPDYPLGSLVD